LIFSDRICASPEKTFGHSGWTCGSSCSHRRIESFSSSRPPRPRRRTSSSRGQAHPHGFDGGYLLFLAFLLALFTSLCPSHLFRLVGKLAKMEKFFARSSMSLARMQNAILHLVHSSAPSLPVPSVMLDSFNSPYPFLLCVLLCVS